MHKPPWLILSNGIEIGSIRSKHPRSKTQEYLALKILWKAPTDKNLLNSQGKGRKGRGLL